MKLSAKLIASLVSVSSLTLAACAEQETQTEAAPSESMSNADIAVGIVEKGLIGGNADFINAHVAEDYIQHNPQAEDGRAGLIGFANYLSSTGLENLVSVERVLEQGDLVMLHVVYDFGGQKSAGFDLFRFEDGVAVEHWDGLQEVVTETASGRSMVDGTKTVADKDKTAENTALVTGFIEDVLIGGKTDLIGNYIGEEYLQHNPNVADGRSGLIAFATGLQEQGISFRYTATHNVVADGNFVFTQNEGEFGGAPTAFYDLFRVEDGKIIEHWDAVQQIPEEMAHTNGMF